MKIEEYNLELFNENLNEDNFINEHDIVLDASNVNVGIDDHFIPPFFFTINNSCYFIQ